MRIIKSQRAVQLTGAGELKFNPEKPVYEPGRHQVLCKVEAVGLCFSDLKLLKQFSSHARKSEIISGIGHEILRDIPSYVPGEAATVPGHEAVVRISAVGDGVKGLKPGDRCLVQADYRWLHTANGNAAFGYNFEGALQEYVLMDERVITSPEGRSMLLPVSENLSASAAALIEPWACVEDAYATKERRELKKDGKTAVVKDADLPPHQNLWCGGVPGSGMDDIIYFGHNPQRLEALFPKLAAGGLLNIVLCGGAFGRDAACAIGRIHYGGLRLIGTTGRDPAEAMRYIPPTCELRKGDSVNIIGAAGPMGVMHVIRNICQGVQGIKIFAGDMDEERLKALNSIAEPLAKKNNVEYRSYNPSRAQLKEKCSYTVIMAPLPKLIAQAVADSPPGGIINIFAGIPADVSAQIDIDGYIRKHLYFIGTSGSNIDDMEIVLKKVESGRLNTNLSVAAVSGIEGAILGMKAVENHAIPGKIIIYPGCRGLGLVPLDKLKEELPAVARELDNGFWSLDAERKMWEIYGERI